MFDKYFKFLKAKTAESVVTPALESDSVNMVLPDHSFLSTEPHLNADSTNSLTIDTRDVINNQVITDALAIDTHGERTSTPQMLRRFVGRQPVLNHLQQIIGYEFSLRHAIDTDTSPTLQQMRDEMLIASVADLDIPARLGNKLAFIGIAPAMLNSDWLSLLPSHNIILAIDATQITDANQTLAHCRRRSQEGFQIALDKVTPAPEFSALLTLARYVRLDTHQFDALALSKHVIALLQCTNATLIAKQVETEDGFNACCAMAFGGFQGYYFTQRQPDLPQRIDNNRAKVLELLNMVSHHAEIAALETVLKCDVVLSYKLLTFINSPLNGLSCKLDSIPQALMLLGYNQFYRWLTLLLFTSGKLDARGEALLQNSLIRARLTETLGPDNLSSAERDGLFVAGIFSLLDALLNVPMEQAIAQLNLSDNLTQALLFDQGVYAPYLRLAIACENANQAQINKFAAAAGLSVDAVNLAHIKALLWAEEFSH
ncbi:MAG: EAL and HDOD domain-containing protein [Sulfuriferula sp.]